MSSNYTGVPTAAQSPASAPTFGVDPIIVVPADADPNNVATMFTQQYRMLADHVAYLMRNAGAKNKFYEPWVFSGSFPYAVGGSSLTALGASGQWYYFQSNAAASIDHSTTTFSGGTPNVIGASKTNQLILDPSSTNGVINRVQTVYPVAYIQPLLILSARWEVALTAVGTNKLTARVGMKAEPGAVGVKFGFEKLTGDTNWKLLSNDGSTRADSGVPPVANTVQELKINYYGNGTARGLAADYFIDGVSVGTVTTNIPSGGVVPGGGLFPTLETQCTTAGNTTKAHFGGVAVDW